MKKETAWKIKLTTIVIVILGLAFFFRSGWKPSGHFNLNGGTIEITVEEPNTKIYIDNIEEYETKSVNETYTASSVSAQNHSVAISKKGYWPWLKNVDVAKDETVKLRPFSLSQTPMAKEIDTTDPAYTKVRTDFYSHSSPSEWNKLSSPHAIYKVWVDNNTIFAELADGNKNPPPFFCPNTVCATRVEVLTSTKNIDDVSFYKDFDDVLIFSNEDGVYALDLNKNGTQNFQPYFPFPHARFLRYEDTLYILVGDSIKAVSLK